MQILNKTEEINIVELKVEIFRKLHEKKFAPEKIRAVANFLKNYVRLNDENDLVFEKKISKITRNTFTKGIEQQILQQERKAGIKIDVAQ